MYRVRLMPLMLAVFLVPQLLQARPLSLVEVYALALEEDPRINIAELQVDIGEAQKDAARGALLPQGSFNMQFSDNQIEFVEGVDRSQQYPGDRYVLQLRQILFNWSAISARNRSARVLDQRENELLDALGQLSVDVAERYFNVLQADDNVRLILAEKDLVDQQLRETEARYERKLVRVTDFLETQARADQVRTDLIDAQNQAALAREEILLLTGQVITDLAPVRKEASLPALENSLAEWVDSALADNPLLLSKQDAVQAARKGVEEARGENIPTVSFVASGQRSDVGFDNVRSPQRDVIYLGVDVNVPLFAGGASLARLREAWSMYYIAKEEEEGARREVLKKVRGAWLNASASRQRVDAASLTVKSASSAYDAMRKAFGLGSARAADVLEALHRRTRAERDYQQALYAYLFNWLTLQREGGALDADDIESLDAMVIATGRWQAATE